MSKLNKAIEAVKAAGIENKEACLVEIMKVCETYRSNATIYYTKAVARINGGEVVAPKRPKAAKAIDVAVEQPALATILNGFAAASMKELKAINKERKANGMEGLTQDEFYDMKGRIGTFLTEQA